MTTENARLEAAYASGERWRRWGPYLSERQWGTVREDYGHDGNAWDYFPHDHARSRAYRWGEDGLLGISDDTQLLCFGLALWNGQDAILKERLFGLTNQQGNHGEDCKEQYHYLDSTPTHSYMRALYRYPQAAFPYTDLVTTNAERGYHDPEYELIDTGVFDEDRYFDVEIEYAKASPEDVCIRVSVTNQGPDPAPLRVLPTLWFRNTWSWSEGAPRPTIEPLTDASPKAPGVRASHPSLGTMELFAEDAQRLLFVDNETNHRRLFEGENGSDAVKDGIHDFVVEGRSQAVRTGGPGTKVAADFEVTLGPGATQVFRLRLTRERPPEIFGPTFESIIADRVRDADAFYEGVIPRGLTDDEQNVMRQALAGMMWSKQYYNLDKEAWLHGRASAAHRRNPDWQHLRAHDVISMPDKWEYPWFAVWDLAFHAFALMLVDLDFAKLQLSMFLEDRYLRDDGAIPAYEWNFSDVNPPVHAYATLRVFQFERAKRGKGDIAFLSWMFERLSRNFDWWVERKSIDGRDVFEGGFLGLDNIGVFDRSHALPTGGHLEQADGTSWMVIFAQVMLRMSLELCRHDPSYEDRALHYFDRVLSIAGALDRVGEHDDELWDEDDGFFYDVLRFPDGHATRIKVRSLVGLLPLGAVAIFEPETLAGLPRLRARLQELAEAKDTATIHCPTETGYSNRRMLAIVDEVKLRRILSRMLDEEEFYSPFGIRSLSRGHRDQPYVFHWAGQEHVVRYLPAESDSGMFGGNSNWRGPVWMPTNFLLVRALYDLYSYYGDRFTVECPTGSGQHMTLFEVAQDLSKRLVGIFTRDAEGRRPVFGGAERLQSHPHWRDHVLFYEYFHGDNGAGIGASHQTGWTGLVASLMSILSRLDADDFKDLDARARARMLAGTDGEAQ